MHFSKYINYNILFLLSGLFLFSCKAKQATQNTKPTDSQTVVTPKTERSIKGVPKEKPIEFMPRPLPGPVLTMETTPAYGENPVYELRIFKSGLVTWLGKEDTKMKGHFEAKVHPEEIQNWLIRADKEGYFDLADAYPTNGRIIPDFSNTILFIQFKEHQKTITNNYDAPAAFRQLESDLYAWAMGLNWQGVNAQ